MKFWNSFAVFATLCCMAFCSYKIYREFTLRVDKAGGEIIGTITFKKRSASRKYSETVLWEEIAQQSPIYNYDAIRTLEYSAAVINLKDGTNIELDQNTMLVVILSEKGIDINFDRGGVSAKSGRGSKNLITLNSRDASVELDSGDISVNSSDSGVDIALNSGSAKVAARGRDVNLSPDIVATLKDGEIQSEKRRFFPEFPLHNSYMVSRGGSMPVNFRWRSEPEGEVRVEISGNSSFTNLVRSFSSVSGMRVVELAPGSYYWRIVRGKERSFPGKFTIVQSGLPELVYPGNNQKITFGEGTGPMMFKWRKSGFAEGYEITIARDPAMQDVAAKLTSKINAVTTADLEPGIYFWTARSVYPPGFDSGEMISGPGRFILEKTEFALSKPVPLDPGVLTTAGPFTLYWQGVRGADRYSLEIASDPEFEKNMLRGETRNTFFRVSKKIPEGNYYWRIGASRGKVSSDKSDTASLLITKPVDIKLVSPKNGTVLFNRPEVINFSWNDPNQGYKYLVEISERTDFSRLCLVLESDLHNVTGESPGAGSFFWRVVLKDKTGKVIAKSSENRFSIPAQLRMPVPVSPDNNEKIVPGRVRFQWRKVTGANEYEVEVFQRIAGAEKTMIIYSSRGNYLEASNLSLFRPGKFSWLVRAKQVKRGEITAFRESGKSFFEIESVELLPPPEVNEPGVLYK